MQKKIKILFLAANPRETSQLRLDEEIRQIQAKIDQSKKRSLIELKSSWAVRPDDIIQQLNKLKPDIVHFSGHGDRSGNIILNDEYGHSKLIAPKAIQHLFNTIKKNVKLVFLNLCYSKIQADALIDVIDTVIGMKKPITDNAAIVFAASFYRALGYGESVHMAYQQGITAILLDGLDEEDTPVILHNNKTDPGNTYLLNRTDDPLIDDKVKKKSKDDIIKYLNSVIAENQFIKLPSIAEGSLLPEIPLEKVYVSLKVQQVISPVELAKAQEFFQRKIHEKIKQLDHQPGIEEIKQFESEILQEYPVMNALRNDHRNSSIYKGNIEETERNIVINFAQAFKRERYLIILGAPGSGKSTLTKWISLQLASAYKQEIITGKKMDVMVPVSDVDAPGNTNPYGLDNLGPARLSVLIKVTDYAREYVRNMESTSKPFSLIEYICELFSKTMENGRQVIIDFFNRDAVVVLLDGMDEINSDRNPINNEIEKFIRDWIRGKGLFSSSEEENLWKEPGDVGGNQIIITSRIVGYHQAPLKKTTLTHVTIETMQPDSIKHFCDIWTRHITIAEKGKLLSREDLDNKIVTDAEELKNAIFENNKTLIFATNPLTLTLLAVVFKSDKKLPSQRVELYERLSEILIEKWRNSGLSVQEVYYVLPDIAFYMHSQKDSITEAGLLKQSKTSFAHYKSLRVEDISKEQEDTVINPFVKKLQEQVGLIAETGTGSYQFYHRSFQEFFAAISLLRMKDKVIEKIISHLEDPIWREPIYLALEYTALKKKRIDFKIDITSEEIVRGLLDAKDSLKDLIPRTAFLIGTALPEMEDLGDDTIYEIIVDLLDLFIDEHNESPNRFLKTKIEEIIEKLYNSPRNLLVRDIFFKILQEQNNPRRISAVTYLIHTKQWFNEKYENAFQKLSHVDSSHLNFPIQSALLKYYSSELHAGTSPNLYFKKKLLTDSNLLSRVAANHRWIKLIALLYGGIPDTGSGKTWMSMEKMKYHINTKFGTAEERYEWAVTLDTQSGENSKKLFNKPDFNPKYIFKESFFTKKILACLVNDEPPENLADHFKQIVDLETDRFKKAEALLALSIFDTEYVRKTLQKDKDLGVIFFNRVKHIKSILYENLQHFFGYYTHKKKNLSQLQEFFENISDGEDRFELFGFIKQVNNSLDLPPFDTCYSIPEKRLFKTDYYRSQLAMETEGWVTRFNGLGSDRVYNIAVLLDTCSVELKRDEKLFVSSIAEIELYYLLNPKFLPENMRAEFSLTACMDVDEVVKLFESLKYIPPDMYFVKDWVLWSIDARLADNPDLLPEAILHGFEIENSKKLSSRYPEFWNDGKRYDLIEDRIYEIKDNYLKFRAYLLLLKQTADLNFINKCLEQINFIASVEQKILAIIDVLQFPIYLLVPGDIKNLKFIISKFKSLYIESKNKLYAVKRLESRILLGCKLAALSGEVINETTIQETFAALDQIRSSAVQNNIIAACVRIFENEPEMRGRFESYQQKKIHSSIFEKAGNVCPDHLLNYFSMLELYSGLDRYSVENFEEGNEDFLWNKLADGIADGAYCNKLFEIGIKNDGLKLTQAAFDTITKLLASEGKETDLINLLSLCYLPAFYDYQNIEECHNASNRFLNRFTSLLLAEQGRLTPTIMADIIHLLDIENDKIRIRVSIAIHGKCPSSSTPFRKFRLGKIDLESLIILNKQRLNTSSPYISTKLGWFNHNIVYDSSQVIFDIVKMVESKQADHIYLENILKTFELVNVKIIKDLKTYFNTKEQHVKKLLLSSYLKLSYIHKIFAGELVQYIKEEELQILESSKYYLFTFDAIVTAVVDAGTLFEKDEIELINYLDNKIRAVSKIDFRTAYDAGHDQFAKILVKAGSTLYVSPDTYVRNAIEAGLEFQKFPNMIPTLMLWTFNTLQDELNNDEHDALASYLVLLLGFVVEKNPDTYAYDELIRKFDVENLLNKAIKEHNSWLVRRGAVVLLSYLNEKSEKSVDVLSDGLKDVYFVQYGIDACWRYFENIYDNKNCIRKVLSNLHSDSGHLSSVSAKILSEIAKSKKCPEIQRKQIITDLAECLRKEISNPVRKRQIFSHDENTDGQVLYKGSLEDVLYDELLTITAVY